MLTLLIAGIIGYSLGAVSMLILVALCIGNDEDTADLLDPNSPDCKRLGE